MYFKQEDIDKLLDNLKIEEVIDVVFWLEYVKNKDIKNTLLNILIKKGSYI